ncbi:glutamate-5-semialdehyde dehydrogenase [Suttonella ornithocola]|uniref:Gamma-glutamyl phosphate reductase n=1 Tax=Suttonella ornithocola TaxID=279832 RepID=A0A380MXW0_9GAMM|nr:glutamate-5-semialdehyde dehydrogenase [Suttonella ornithocola]SUO97122.1 Gamma-glutamyl phosphate reductase [Suttonella ornithocola]
MSLVITLGKKAKTAAQTLASATTLQKNTALLAIADHLLAETAAILSANAKDIALGKQKNLAPALLDRLSLNETRLKQMADGIRQIASLPDPVGEMTGMKTNEKGLKVGRMRAPLGVIGIIYESRPNVTADAAALCLKSGNAAILRGGSEAIHSNQAILASVKHGLQHAGLPEDSIQLINDTNRAHVTDLLQANEYVDVIIPRGGKGLVKLVSEQARMPVIKHLDGLCHLYIDVDADFEIALRCADNGKTYRYGICGATETLLIHKAIAFSILPAIADIYQRKSVEMRGCPETVNLLKNSHSICLATESDWQTEYLAPIISIKIVEDYQQAIEHIAQYSSKHTDSIVTNSLATAQRFLREVDSASVMVNTPTCFADGYEYGLGAEIGISTDKIHWRGPVGLEGLTSQKFIIISDGITR